MTSNILFKEKKNKSNNSYTVDNEYLQSLHT